MLMEYEFSALWLILGILIAAVGVLMIRYYKEIGDNLVSGVRSYDKVKFWGVIVAVGGALTAFGILPMIVKAILRAVIPGLD